MCGIAGRIDFSGHNPDKVRPRIKRATDRIHYRGPDAEGFYIDDHAALGHRRLSIIDVASGQQPMHSIDGRLHIVFNGEIYNFLELRDVLEKKGHRFQTRSDTEVILAGYREWGEGVAEKLNGMFAFAVWDSGNRTLYVARDRVGKKPLYFWSEGGRFAFASELKALLPLCSAPGDVSPEALDCYFCFGYIPSPLTIYENVQKLEPAHCMTITENGLRKRRYWTLRYAPDETISMDTALEEFEALLDEATRCRLMSEVPLGAFLSGGLDSTLVVASMARGMDQPVLTNSIGFGDRRHNELPLAKMVAGHLGTDHREYVLEADAVDVLPQIAVHFDEPFADSSAVPTWYVCQMARRNVTVALSGDGGDESFGGYTFRYLPHIFESRIRSAVPVALRGVLFGGLGRLYPGNARLPRYLRLKTILENLAVSDAEAFYRDLIWLRADTRDRLYSGDFLRDLRGFTPFERVQPIYGACAASDPFSRSLFTDVNFYMTEDVLVKVDRMSMAHALEVRAPLLDYRILEFAGRLPRRLKMDDSRGKLILRRAASRRLPKAILEQPKHGFSIPADRWLRNELKEMAAEAIFGKSGIVGDVLNRKELQKMWRQHQTGARDHSVFLWALMMLGLWEEKHFSGSATVGFG